MLIAFTNTKGGVGKSTLATHCAVWLFDCGHKVALLDLDRQQSSCQWVKEAEPRVTARIATTPEEVAAEVQDLKGQHDFIVADGPAGLEDTSRTLLLLADLALFPLLPSILDVRSVSLATAILKYAQTINAGRPQGRLILNRMKRRDRISRELIQAVPSIGLSVASATIRDLQPYRDAAQQGTVVTRMRSSAREAASDLAKLFQELLPDAGAGRQGQELPPTGQAANE